MRYLWCLVLLFVVIVGFSLVHFDRRVNYSPPLTECRIDDDCTHCVDTTTIIYGHCVASQCRYKQPVACPLNQPGWGVRCVSEQMSYCLSEALP